MGGGRPVKSRVGTGSEHQKWLCVQSVHLHRTMIAAPLPPHRNVGDRDLQHRGGCVAGGGHIGQLVAAAAASKGWARVKTRTGVRRCWSGH